MVNSAKVILTQRLTITYQDYNRSLELQILLAPSNISPPAQNCNQTAATVRTHIHCGLNPSHTTTSKYGLNVVLLYHTIMARPQAATLDHK